MGRRRLIDVTSMVHGEPVGALSDASADSWSLQRSARFALRGQRPQSFTDTRVKRAELLSRLRAKPPCFARFSDGQGVVDPAYQCGYTVSDRLIIDTLSNYLNAALKIIQVFANRVRKEADRVVIWLSCFSPRHLVCMLCLPRLAYVVRQFVLQLCKRFALTCAVFVFQLQSALSFLGRSFRLTVRSTFNSCLTTICSCRQGPQVFHRQCDSRPACEGQHWHPPISGHFLPQSLLSPEKKKPCVWLVMAMHALAADHRC